MPIVLPFRGQSIVGIIFLNFLITSETIPGGKLLSNSFSSISARIERKSSSTFFTFNFDW